MIVGIAMVLIVAMAAFAIDISQWYVGRHQAQVVADSAALAAANCLSSTKCTQTTSNGDAATVANQYAANGVQIKGVSFSGSTVTVTTQNKSASSFAGLFGISSVTSSANAVASYKTLTSITFTCNATGAASCMSLFAGNNYCPSTTTPPYPVGLDLITGDNGGGGATMTDMWTNGWISNQAHSGSYTASGAATCNKDVLGPTSWTPSTAQPYPAIWTKPSCTFSASSWTTATITADGPGVYCVTSTPTSGSCTSSASAGTGGTLNVSLGSIPAGAYEFVGPCVILSGSGSGVTAIAGQPLVYGTSNITTAATLASGLPTCAVNDGSTGSTTWLVGNGSGIDASIYDQCGTFDATGNNSGFTGFVEAWNINIEKNGGITGNGPANSTAAGEKVVPGGDSLVS